MPKFYQSTGFCIDPFIFYEIKTKLSNLRSTLKKQRHWNSMALFVFMWAMRGSNPRPPRCKRGALNQLS